MKITKKKFFISKANQWNKELFAPVQQEKKKVEKNINGRRCVIEKKSNDECKKSIMYTLHIQNTHKLWYAT